MREDHLMTVADPDIRGLFPLDLVLLPGERLPLHVFEPRYRELLADCVLTPSEFVLPLATEGGVAEVACAARFETLLRRFSDGRMNVVVQGTRRVRITAATGEQPYLTGAVEDVADVDEAIDRDLERRVTERFDRVVAQVAGRHLDVTADPVPRSYAVAGRIQLESMLKQALLEERSENARLGLVDEILVRALAQIDHPPEDSGSDGDTPVPG